MILSSFSVQFSQVNAINLFPTKKYESASITITITQMLIHEDRDYLDSGEIYLEGCFYYHNTSDSLKVPLDLSDNNIKVINFQSDTIEDIDDGDLIFWNYELIQMSNVTAYLLEISIKESDNNNDDSLGKITLNREKLADQNLTTTWYNALEPEGGSKDLQAELEIEEELTDRSNFVIQTDLLSLVFNLLISVIISIIIGCMGYFFIHWYSQLKSRPEMKDGETL